MSATSCKRAININIKISLTSNKLFKNKIFVILDCTSCSARTEYFIFLNACTWFVQKIKRLTDNSEEEIL